MRDNGIPTDALESGRRKILVVDDDQDLVELITDVLAAMDGSRLAASTTVLMRA